MCAEQEAKWAENEETSQRNLKEISSVDRNRQKEFIKKKPENCPTVNTVWDLDKQLADVSTIEENTWEKKSDKKNQSI